MPLSPEQIAECLKVLEGLLEHREDLLEVSEPMRKRMLEVAGRLAPGGSDGGVQRVAHDRAQ